MATASRPDVAHTPCAAAHRLQWATVATVVALTLLAPQTTTGAQDDVAASDLASWCEAVATHRPGEFDGPSFDIAPWRLARLARVLDEVGDLARDAQRQASRGRAIPSSRLTTCPGIDADTLARGDPSRLLKRGAQLHTDIAALYDPRMKIDLSAGPRRATTSVSVSDGRVSGFEFDNEHWVFARQLLDRVEPNPRADPAVGAWYHAVAEHLAGRGSFGLLQQHARAGRVLFARDARLFMMEGVKHHAMASPRIQVAIAAVTVPPGYWLDIGARESELQHARRLYEDALRADPDLVEARVRLGHVLGELGQAAPAAAMLRGALDSAREPILEYYAALFLGEQERVLGRADAAREALERAGALYRRAQSPLLALSLVARGRGDRDGAVAAIGRLMQLPGDRHTPDDPWWTFYVSPGRHAAESMARVRDLLAKDGAR